MMKNCKCEGVRSTSYRLMQVACFERKGKDCAAKLMDFKVECAVMELMKVVMVGPDDNNHYCRLIAEYQEVRNR